MSNRFSWRRNLLCMAVATLALPWFPALGQAENKSKEKAPAEAVEAIDLFEAVKQGKVETKFVAHNANRGNLLVKNLTNQPLNVRVPDAFGAVHVLGQFGGGMGGMGGGMGGMGGGGMGGGMGGMGGGGGQTMGGGGMGGGGGGMGMGGMGGGMFRVAPEKTHKIVSNTVCLEFGKPDPNSIMTYNIVPIESVAKDPRVVELCRMLSRGEIPTNVAQAAAWRLIDGLSWEKLASLDRVRSQYSGTIKYFNMQELQYANTLIVQIEKRVGSSENSRDRYQKSYESGESNYAAAGASVQVSGNGFASGSAGAVVVGDSK